MKNNSVRAFISPRLIQHHWKSWINDSNEISSDCLCSWIKSNNCLCTAFWIAIHLLPKHFEYQRIANCCDQFEYISKLINLLISLECCWLTVQHNKCSSNYSIPQQFLNRKHPLMRQSTNKFTFKIDCI